MDFIKSFKVVAVAIFIGIVSGCGGGSSSDGASAKLAKATYENAQKVEEAIFSSAVSSHTYRAKEMSEAKSKANPFVLDIAKDYVKLLDNSSKQERVISQACSSGSLDVSLIDETSSSKTYLYKYDNCNDGVKVINGSVELHLASKHGDLYYVQSIVFKDNYSVKYPNGAKVSIANGGSIDITITGYNSSSDYTFILDTTMKITQNGYSYGYDGLELHYIVSGSSTYWYQTTGIIYINNYQDYVIWDSSYDMFSTPFKVDSNGYPINGEARYIMDGGVLRIIADNGAIVLDL
jgi:hypothetical protein